MQTRVQDWTGFRLWRSRELTTDYRQQHSNHMVYHCILVLDIWLDNTPWWFCVMWIYLSVCGGGIIEKLSFVQLLPNWNGVWQKRWIEIGEVGKQTKGELEVTPTHQNPFMGWWVWLTQSQRQIRIGGINVTSPKSVYVHKERKKGDFAFQSKWCKMKRFRHSSFLRKWSTICKDFSWKSEIFNPLRKKQEY